MADFKSKLRNILDSTFNKNDQRQPTPVDGFNTIDCSLSKESKSGAVTHWNFSLEDFKRKKMTCSTKNPLDQVSSYSDFLGISKGNGECSEQRTRGISRNDLKSNSHKNFSSTIDRRNCNITFVKEKNFSVLHPLHATINNTNMLTSSKGNKINREIDQFRRSLRESTVRNSTMRPNIEVDSSSGFDLSYNRSNSKNIIFLNTTKSKEEHKSILSQVRSRVTEVNKIANKVSSNFPITLKRDLETLDDYMFGFNSNTQASSYLEKYSPKRKR